MNVVDFFISTQFLCGIIIGIVIGFFIVTKVLTNLNLLSRIKYNLNIKNFIFLGTCLITVTLFISSLLNIEIKNQILSTILNFSVSFVFAFMFNEYSNEKAFKEKQKEPAMRSYRHSINILSKLDYGIEITKLIKLNFLSCMQSNGRECGLISNVDRATDLLKTIRMDCVENINGWADILSNDLNKIREIELQEKKRKELLQSIQDEDSAETNLKNIYDQINQINTKIEQLEQEIDPRLKNTLDIRKQYEDDYIEDVKKEIRNKEADITRANMPFEILSENSKSECSESDNSEYDDSNDSA